jgi:hypothetical protein
MILGALLLLLGGGCTLLLGALFVDDPRSMISDMAIILSYWIPLGLLPLIGGYIMFRHGLKLYRAANS